MNSMEPLTKEAILSLNNGTVTFEQARALLNVDLSTFKARLEQLNIFVWNDVNYGPVRIHGGDHEINVVIKDVQTYDAEKAKNCYTVGSTFTFENVIHMIEEDLKLSPGCYKLTFKHPNISFGNVWVRTDRDWHFLVKYSRFRGYFVYLDLEVLPSSQTADGDDCDEDHWEYTWFEESSFVNFCGDEDYSSDEDYYSDEEEEYVKNVFVEDACDEGARDEYSMDGITKKAILSLNNGSVTFEQARAIFNVDLSTFKARLEQLNIFVWKECDGKLVRIHGGDYGITIVINYVAVQAKYYYPLESTVAFEDVICLIEKDLKLSPGCYKLTFKHPKKSFGNILIKIDRDWHFLGLFSRLSGCVMLDLEVFPSNQTADEDA